MKVFWLRVLSQVLPSSAVTRPKHDVATVKVDVIVLRLRIAVVVTHFHSQKFANAINQLSRSFSLYPSLYIQYI